MWQRHTSNSSPWWVLRRQAELSQRWVCNMQERKPNLVQLLNHHRITMAHVAQAARIQRTAVYAVACGIAVSPAVAQQVLDGLHKLAGVQYHLQDVKIVVYDG